MCSPIRWRKWYWLLPVKQIMKYPKPKEAKHSKVGAAANLNIAHAVGTVVANHAQAVAVVIVVVTEVEIVAIVLHVLQQVPVVTNHGATVKGATEAAAVLQVQVEEATATAEAQAEVTRKDIKIEYIEKG